LLNSLDGRTVTYYVNAAGNGVSVGNPNGPSIDQGEGYAGGGMVRARMGEIGGEYVSLAGGGTAYAPVDAIYSVPSGSYVHTTPRSKEKQVLGTDCPGTSRRNRSTAQAL
jgi:hypothetical protein